MLKFCLKTQTIKRYFNEICQDLSIFFLKVLLTKKNDVEVINQAWKQNLQINLKGKSKIVA